MHDAEQHDAEHHNAGVLTRRLRSFRGAPRWALLISIAVVVLAVGLLAGVWATSSSSGRASAHTAQPRRPAANDVVETEGFTLYNNSSQTLRYDGYDSSDGGGLEGGGPTKGTEVPPNGSMHFEQVYKFLTDTSMLIHFAVPSEPGVGPPTFDFYAEVDAFNSWSGRVEDPNPASNLAVSLDDRSINVNNA